ncbi:MAG TPA: TerC/Alx family metal homeostasis membrane protein, partial [Steroidobacteraceae bacterium]|nr:TerC/Alx family metal homeostasis membrane protein [Steroidobacteraceae bacterium]
GFRQWPGVAGGRDAVVQFITGYLLEWSLSVDNIFVMALIFTSLAIPQRYQHGVLFWGIVGAIALRGLMIAMGAAMLMRFDWMYYVFGGVVLVSALRMLREELAPGQRDLSSSRTMRLVSRVIPVTPELHRGRFVVRRDGRLAATPLLVALFVVEGADVVFAVDSIPAILAVTRDPFLVFTSNAFAILGLRSLYFAVSGLMSMFRYLNYSLVLILTFVGVKMLLVGRVPVSNLLALAVVLGTLLAGIVASVIATRLEAWSNRPPVP